MGSFSTAAPTRLAPAVQLCALAFLGFIPDDLTAPPATAAARLVDRVERAGHVPLTSTATR